MVSMTAGLLVSRLKPTFSGTETGRLGHSCCRHGGSNAVPVLGLVKGG